VLSKVFWRAWSVAQVIGHLPSKCEALTANQKKKKKYFDNKYFHTSE
jgi:hypothetical protein